jgi:Fe-S oxidoreductase
MRCGFCNAACPTSAVPSAYLESRTCRGRAILFRDLLLGAPPEDPMSDEVAADMEYCMACGRCMTACPLEVPIPLLVGAYRELRARASPREAADALLRRYAVLDRLAGEIPHLYNAASKAIRGPLARALGFREDLELPRASPRRPELRSWDDGDVVLLVDTFTWAHEPEAPEAVWRLLTAMGLRPRVVGPIDHGMVLLDLGYISDLREEGSRLVREISRISGGRPVVAVSPAWYYMSRRIYPLLIGGEARELAEMVIDVYSLIGSRCAGSGGQGGTVIYHESCLAKGQLPEPQDSRGPEGRRILRGDAEELLRDGRHLGAEEEGRRAIG